MVYAAKVIKKDLKQSVYGSFFLMNMFFFVPLQNKNILRIIINETLFTDIRPHVRLHRRSQCRVERERPGTDTGHSPGRVGTVQQRTDRAQCHQKGTSQAAYHQSAADHETGRPERADALFTGTDSFVRHDLCL